MKTSLDELLGMARAGLRAEENNGEEIGKVTHRNAVERPIVPLPNTGEDILFLETLKGEVRAGKIVGTLAEMRLQRFGCEGLQLEQSCGHFLSVHLANK
jgi:hypothetical protein